MYTQTHPTGVYMVAYPVRMQKTINMTGVLVQNGFNT